ncbi:uncharacterized protein LOC128557521 [Mercenaria mercenaria]|uniref:uncharacterized protein LOC128557521 n=1 Tax=Mercenaria mercenaria TaxID=6596 RepID=UPI00234E9A6B|nr:uncharacterized protein LOC128557521 [Mercenaria mercenaria]
MDQFLLSFIVAFALLCVVSSTSEKGDDSVDLTGTIRTFVETLLNDNKRKDNTDNNDEDLRERVEYLENKVTAMDTKLVEQINTIADLQNVIQMLHKNRKVNLGMETKGITENITEDNFRKAENNNAIERGSLPADRLLQSERRVKRAVGNVAFSAYMTHTNFHTIVGQAFKFDQVLLNDGIGYSKSTGKFTVPLTGVYLFAFHIDARNLMFVRLVVNGVNQVDAVANAHTNTDSRRSYSMGGNTAIIHVRHGQAVWVETYEIQDGITASSNTFRICTFSGVLLY